MSGVSSIITGRWKTSVGGTRPLPGTNRNGNLQITQFYDGAVQPSNAAAQIAGALFYGAAQDNGGPFSDPNILSDGNLQWSVPAGDTSSDLDSTAVNVDQQGLGTVDQYWFPEHSARRQHLYGLFPGEWRGPNIRLAPGSRRMADSRPDELARSRNAAIANFAVDPVNGSDMVISSNTGRVFATTDGGEQWFDIGDPGVFGSPGDNSLALAYGAPDPNAPEGVGNLGNFIYVGTSTGQIYVTQDGGGSGTSNDWINISTGLDGSQVESITTDPTRGSHAAYAVTENGVYFMANSVPSAANPTPTWINISGVGVNNIHDLAYTIFGQTYNPTTDPNSIKLNQAVALTSIVADWEYTIPNSATDPAGPGFHPVLYVSSNSGVYQSIDDGLTWSLFPNTTLGAETDGGNLPHVAVSSLSLSLGNVNIQNGMPNLAGPYDPTSPTATPDPDLLLASTFGRGSFAINMAPIVLPSDTAIDPSSVSGTEPDGTSEVITDEPVIDGLSSITAFGNATRITIYDETPTDATYGEVIGGFDPSNVAGTNVAANWTNAFGNFSIAVNPGEFVGNGVKTIAIVATDDAGSVGNKVTITFTLNVPGLAPPSKPITPTLQLSPQDVTGSPGYTNIPDPNLIGVTSPNTSVELLNGMGVAFSPPVITTSDAFGNFTLTFPEQTPASGTFTVEAEATNKLGSSFSSVVTFTIITQAPATPSNFHLDPNADTGIKGDNITSDRTPDYLGTTEPGATVELFVNGSSTVWATAVAGATGSFSVQLPYTLTNGTVSLYVEAIDLAGNLSAPSNLLTISIVSVASDYNGDSYSDAAAYVRDTTDNEGLWFVAPTSLVPASPAAPPFWFNSGTPLGPANAIPFQGDFDGDGQTDLAYYVPSTATWGMVDSKSKTFTSFVLGTPNVSVPISGYFDANAPDEVGVFTISSGMGVWSIVTATSGVRTVFFGATGDIPVPGDYLGLGTDQIAVYRPSNGDFYVLQPNGSVTTLNPGVGGSPDLASLVPVPGGYDNTLSSEKTEAAVFDPNTGTFTILGPSGPYNVSQGFQKGDIPAPADYAGLGTTQEVVYRPSTGQFIEAGGKVIATFGGPTSAFIPVTAPLSYRTPADPPAAPPPPSTGTGTTGTGTSTGTGTTGTSTGTGTTGTSTGTGTTGTSTGTSTGSSGGSGTGSTTGTGSTGSSTTPAKPPVAAPGSNKKPVAKKPAPPKKTIVKAPPKKAAPKKVERPAPKPKVIVVRPVKKVVKVVAKPATTKSTHLVDVALETVHVNLRKKG